MAKRVTPLGKTPDRPGYRRRSKEEKAYLASEKERAARIGAAMDAKRKKKGA